MKLRTVSSQSAVGSSSSSGQRSNKLSICQTQIGLRRRQSTICKVSFVVLFSADGVLLRISIYHDERKWQVYDLPGIGSVRSITTVCTKCISVRWSLRFDRERRCLFGLYRNGTGTNYHLPSRSNITLSTKVVALAEVQQASSSVAQVVVLVLALLVAIPLIVITIIITTSIVVKTKSGEIQVPSAYHLRRRL